MHVIIVDDNRPFSEALRAMLLKGAPGLAYSIVPVAADSEPREVAQSVAETVSAARGEAIALINVEMKLNGRRQEQAGVDVLKWLRLGREPPESARTVHCVMYAFQGLEQLLRHEPRNLILLSPGTTFLRLPFPDSAALHAYLGRLASRRAPDSDRRALAAYVRAGFTLPDERHGWANEWAARQMLRVSYFRSDRLIERNDLEVQPVTKEALRDALYLFDTTREVDLVGEADYEEIGFLREQIQEQLGGRTVLLIDDQGNQISGHHAVGWHSVYAGMLAIDRRTIVDALSAQAGLNVNTVCIIERELDTLDRRLYAIASQGAGEVEQEQYRKEYNAKLDDLCRALRPLVTSDCACVRWTCVCCPRTTSNLRRERPAHCSSAQSAGAIPPSR